MLDQEKTTEIHNWIKSQSDDIKMRFALNWRIPHSVFNTACNYRPAAELQEIDWYSIHKSRDLGNFEHGGKVFVL